MIAKYLLKLFPNTCLFYIHSYGRNCLFHIYKFDHTLFQSEDTHRACCNLSNSIHLDKLYKKKQFHFPCPFLLFAQLLLIPSLSLPQTFLGTRNRSRKVKNVNSTLRLRVAILNVNKLLHFTLRGWLRCLQDQQRQVKRRYHY